MKVRVLSVGKDRSGLFEPAAQEYFGRLKHYATCELVELPASKHSGPKAQADEGDRIIGALKPREALVALDERGKLLSSVELSQFIARQSGDLLFCVGGDEGLAEPVRQKAALTLSLSKMTLPHRLARVVLLEQIYRAFTVMRGEPYHK